MTKPLDLDALPDSFRMTVEEAASAIHHSVKPRSLTKAIANKKLQAIKPGKTVLVTAGAVRAWLVSCQTILLPPPAPAVDSASQRAMDAAARLRTPRKTR